MKRLPLVILTLLALLTGACAQENAPAPAPEVLVPPQALKLVESAREQVGVTLVYDPAYVSLKYPGGDVPMERGVCTDVVIRAFRAALDQDLQQLVHVDMKANFSKYPKLWGLKSTDKNIDHRRVPNLRRYFERQGYEIELAPEDEDKPGDFLPGDLVTCTVAGKLPHIMLVSDRRSPEGVPLVIHNIGGGAQEEDVLFTYPHTGHYRIKFEAGVE